MHGTSVPYVLSTNVDLRRIYMQTSVLYSNMAKKRKTAALPPLMLAIKAGDIDKVTSLLEGHDRMTWKEVGL